LRLLKGNETHRIIKLTQQPAQSYGGQSTQMIMGYYMIDRSPESGAGIVFSAIRFFSTPDSRVKTRLLLTRQVLYIEKKI